MANMKPSGPVPLRDPAAMVTAHAVKMSKRSARVFGWLQARCAGIRSWSTDDEVQLHMPRLQAAIRDLDAWIALAAAGKGPPELASPLDLDSLKSDIQAIMRRVPAARVA